MKSKTKLAAINKAYPRFIVICGDDDDQPLRRVIATRRTFKTYEAAQEYARPISKGRRAQIVGCPFNMVIVRLNQHGTEADATDAL